jgi:two-component system CheB/CheR fusion protein
MAWDQAGGFGARRIPETQGPKTQAFRRGPRPGAPASLARPVVFIVDDEYFSRLTLRSMIEDEGWAVEEFSDCETFLAVYRQRPEACLVLDVHFPGMGGIDLLRRMGEAAMRLPAVVVSGSSDIPEAVQSMKIGAIDFIEKPVDRETLLGGLRTALAEARRMNAARALEEDATGHLAHLTPRQNQIMTLVLAGHPSKNIAADLGISQRTVENHRAAIMCKTGARSLPALARLAIAASPDRQEAASAGVSR